MLRTEESMVHAIESNSVSDCRVADWITRHMRTGSKKAAVMKQYACHARLLCQHAAQPVSLRSAGHGAEASHIAGMD